jgi:hypothetical protein
MRTIDYNGRTYTYTDENHVFHYELGRLDNSYKTIIVSAYPEPAIHGYEGSRVSNGYKKRLSMVDRETGVKTVMARQLSKGVQV